MKRRSYLFLLLALVLVTAAVLLLATRRSAPPPPPKPSPLSAPAGGEERGPKPEPPVASPAEAPAAEAPVREAAEAPRGRRLRPGEPLRIPAGRPIPEIFPYEKERGLIQSLASTYDAKRIPEIAAFLDHADPLVREAALQGLIQLSSPEAAPVLRAAAAKAKSAEEAAALREAADFLSQTGPG